MISGKRIAVLMPAFNAEETLPQSVREIPETVDIKILVDDSSSDRTLGLAQRLGLRVFAHDRNYGYGRNQQTCYREALATGADVVVMLHPDQYTPVVASLTPLPRTVFVSSANHLFDHGLRHDCFCELSPR